MKKRGESFVIVAAVVIISALIVDSDGYRSPGASGELVAARAGVTVSKRQVSDTQHVLGCAAHPVTRMSSRTWNEKRGNCCSGSRKNLAASSSSGGGGVRGGSATPGRHATLSSPSSSARVSSAVASHGGSSPPRSSTTSSVHTPVVHHWEDTGARMRWLQFRGSGPPGGSPTSSHSHGSAPPGTRTSSGGSSGSGSRHPSLSSPSPSPSPSHVVDTKGKGIASTGPPPPRKTQRPFGEGPSGTKRH